MLVLQRRENESVVINNHQIVVTVVAIRGNIVRLGIKAPNDVPIHRDEIQFNVDLENGVDPVDYRNPHRNREGYR
jgi:carbon storage regulator